MAGLPIQIGDLIAMAQVAQTLMEYGWGKYSSAGTFAGLLLALKPSGILSSGGLFMFAGRSPSRAWLMDHPPHEQPDNTTHSIAM